MDGSRRSKIRPDSDVASAHISELPFHSDWMDGRFPTYSIGIPEMWFTVLVVGVGFVVVMSVTVVSGLAEGLFLLAAWFWLFCQSRHRLVIQRVGIAAGIPWGPLVPWHKLQSVSFSVRGTRAYVRYRSDYGGGECVVPTGLIPAIRGRLWRLGGIELKRVEATVSDRYLQWVGISWSTPWFVLLGASTTVWVTSEPWTWLTILVIISVILGLVGSSVRSRALGWRGGGILWLIAFMVERSFCCRCS